MAGEWVSYSLDQLYDFSSGLSKPRSAFGRGHPFLSFKDIFYNSAVPLQLEELVDSTEKERTQCSVRRGDVFLTRTSETMDELGMSSVALRDVANATFNGFTKRLRPKSPSKVVPEYARYYFRAPAFRQAVTAMSSMSTRASLNNEMLSRLSITLPSSEEQAAIGHILGTLDDKIEMNRRISETLEAMARALFTSWFVDFEPVRAKAEARDPGLPGAIADLFPRRFRDSDLGGIPEGWRALPLPEVITVNPTRSLRKGDVAPYLDMANMPTRGHTPDSVIDRPFGSGTRFVNGDTLVARITPCLENGKTAYVDFLENGQVGWGSTEYIVLRSKPPLPEELAYCLARSEEFREFAIQSMNGSSGRQRVATESLSDYLFPAPPGPVAEQFGAMVRPLFGRVRAAARESETLVNLRKTLLPRLISGELRLREPERIVGTAT